eukprot:CAMPEP_0118932508 /NCGR_PEP_ID=MMETSP1169-20130426/10466_1 /TAXON_ID=36882 /ORGANISM="Pyramimonas obovata, Strain CCMP722" /LENGTH=124 /DNA_ID=CAMNT_0006875177 /DNA_START=336 /DNA_END=710 /DNA_ORIENTATION=-
MPETYAFAKEHNPLFLSGPDWLRAATCFSAYAFSAGYLGILIGYTFGLDAIRLPTLVFLGMKLYALAFYHYMEFTSKTPPQNMAAYWGPEAPYLMSLGLMLHRMMSTSRPFSTTAPKKSPKKAN